MIKKISDWHSADIIAAIRKKALRSLRYREIQV